MRFTILTCLCLIAFCKSYSQTSDLADTSSSPTASRPALVFGGRHQYRTLTVGLNAGILSPFLAIGGTNSFTKPTLMAGYGISINKQLAHSFGIDVNFVSGNVAGSTTQLTNSIIPNSNNFIQTSSTISFNTRLGGALSVNAHANVTTINFLKRKKALGFFVSAGVGKMAYRTNFTLANGINIKANDYAYETFIPVGGGTKFKLNNKLAVSLGYSLNFVNNDTFDIPAGIGPNNIEYTLHKDKFSYGYGGIDYTFGNKTKPNLYWANPVAAMYDELIDPKLKQEVEILKTKILKAETTIDLLKKDSDGDGVADADDKCPNTPAGVRVNGAGCPIKLP